MIEVLTVCMSLAAIISIITFLFTYRREKIRDTIKAYADLQEDLYQFYEYQEGEIETFVDDRQSEEYKALSSSLAQIEVYATGVKRGLYDFDTMYSIAHGYIDGSLRERIEYMLDMKSFGKNSFMRILDGYWRKWTVKLNNIMHRLTRR
ncbi:MAG: hypothetical protein MSS24_01715 [Clostridiales bacterium]|nr:hypothetical protein [Clostridiales bacterium]